MNRKLFFLILIGFVFSANATAWATQLGDPAPDLAISEWIKGGPVAIEKKANGKIYVVAFWATWCPYCGVAAPVLTRLQEKYRDKGVVMVGITDEEVETVKAYMMKNGGEMGYAVGIDDSGKTSDRYLKAFEVKGIPHAFIVDAAGNIVWQGNPLDEIDKVLEEVVSGRYDPTARKQLETAKKLFAAYLYLAKETDEKELLTIMGNKVYEYSKSDVKSLEKMAWEIAITEELRYRDLNQALKAVEKAWALCSGSDASVADTYARVLFEMGRKKEAIEYQKRAVSLCKDDEERENYKENLEEYLKTGL